MKYRIWEMMLNEYVDHPQATLMTELEANSFEEAHKLARQLFPNRGPLRIDNYQDGGNVSYLFEDAGSSAKAPTLRPGFGN